MDIAISPIRKLIDDPQYAIDLKRNCQVSGFRFYCLFHRIQKMYYGEKEYYIQNYIRVGRDQDVVNIKYIYLVCLGNFKHLN